MYRITFLSRQRSLRTLFVIGILTLVAVVTTTVSPPRAAAATGGVKVYLLRPNDVAEDPSYVEGITNVMRESQQYYQQELGKTFQLSDPVVEVVEGEHERTWYENNPSCDEKYCYVIFNGQAELIRRFGLKDPDPDTVYVLEVMAEGEGAGGGAHIGWVMLSGHDADGAAGKRQEGMGRWVGGMVHELGHAFGLPDSSGDDTTPMSACLYGFPACNFEQGQKDGILNGPYSHILS